MGGGYCGSELPPSFYMYCYFFGGGASCLAREFATFHYFSDIDRHPQSRLNPCTPDAFQCYNYILCTSYEIKSYAIVKVAWFL